MRNKSLLIVAGVAGVAAAVAAIVVSNRSSHEAPKGLSKEATLLFPGLRDRMNDVAMIKLKRGAEEVAVAKVAADKPDWVVTNRGNYPAEFDPVRRLIGGLAEATVVEAKTSKPEFYDKIGVGDTDKPGAMGTKVELQDAAGKPLAALVIGTTSREGGGENEPGGSKPRYFVRKLDEAQTYLAKGDLAVQAGPMTWVNRSIVEADGSKVKSVTVTQTVNGAPETIRVSKGTAADQKYSLENMPAGRQLKDEYKVTNLGQSFAGMTMDDVAPATGMDFSKPEATVEAALFDGEFITARMITKDGKKYWAFEARYEEPPTTGAPAAAPVPPASEEPKGPAPAAAGESAGASPDAAQPDQAKEAAAKAEAAKAEAAKAEAAKAQAEEKAAATKRVAQLNEKCGPWAYVLPEYKITAVLVKLEDLLKPVETPAAGTPAPSPAPDGDSGSLLGPH
jgi:hypothetical protein